MTDKISLCPHSSMDRVPVSETVDAGSIPAGGTVGGSISPASLGDFAIAQPAGGTSFYDKRFYLTTKKGGYSGVLPLCQKNN